MSVTVIHQVPIGEVYCDNEFNCRGHIAPIDVIDLAASIKKIGLQQPIIIQPYDKIPGKNYRIISGHRRYWAHRVNSAETIESIIRESLNELEARKLNLEENIKRKDLNIVQEAKALVPFVQARWTQREIAQHLSMPEPWVHTRVNLLKLPEEIQKEAAAGFLTQEHIKALAQMKGNSNRMFEAVRKIKDSKLRGEHKRIEIATKKVRPLSKKHRSPTEMRKLMGQVRDVIGNNFSTRCLAWACGEISDFEIFRDLKEEAQAEGINYELPKEILEGLLG